MAKRQYVLKRDRDGGRHRASDRVHKVGFTLGLPDRLDLTHLVTQVLDQGETSACWAHAVAGIIMAQMVVAGVKNPMIPARLFNYWNMRVIEKDPGQDAGVYPADGAKALDQIGYCFEGHEDGQWAFDKKNLFKEPPKPCYDVAATHRLEEYSRIPQSDAAIRHVLSMNIPVLVGIQVPEHMESDEVAASGVVHMPEKGEQLCGGHAVAIFGHDKKRDLYTLLNSWGEGWGKKGFFTLPGQFIRSPALTSDLYLLRARVPKSAKRAA